MSLIRRNNRLINLCCAAEKLDLDESTIRAGGCGTDGLTLIRRGKGKRQRISLIREEVDALVDKLIEDAKKNKSKPANKKTGGLTLVA